MYSRIRSFTRIPSRLARLWPMPVPAKLENGRLIYVDLRSGIGRHLFMRGKFDPSVFGPFRTTLSEGSIFLDIGANVGYYSLLALDYVGQSGRVHAFEIDPRPLSCFRKTIKKNNIPNLHLHEMAVGKKRCKAILLQKKDSGLSSVHSSGEGIEVMMDTLDNLRNSFLKGTISGIKVDVEGGELMVLQGAERILRDDRPVIVLEAEEEHANRYGYKLDDIFYFLKTLNYEYKWLKDTWDMTIVATPRR